MNKQLLIASAAVTITRRELQHAGRGIKAERGQALDEADRERLPAIVHEPDAILYDSSKGNLVYVFTPASDERTGKIAVEVNYSEKLKLKGRRREAFTTNSVRTAGYVETYNLREPRYEVIRGAIQ